MIIKNRLLIPLNNKLLLILLLILILIYTKYQNNIIIIVFVVEIAISFAINSAKTRIELKVLNNQDITILTHYIINMIQSIILCSITLFIFDKNIFNLILAIANIIFVMSLLIYSDYEIQIKERINNEKK